MPQSIIGLFNSFTEANGAKHSLEKQGFSAADISVSAHEGEMAANPSAARPTTPHTHSEGGFMKGMEDFFSDLFGGLSSDDAGHYSEAVRRGGAVVTVTVADESKVDKVRSVLDSAGAIDIDERIAAWRETGYAGYQKDSTPYTAEQVAEERSRIIPVIQEDIEVGKRQVNLGKVRIVSRIVESPVTESVTLREERATIERTPVDRPASAADLAGLEGQSIEVRQTAEKAVVSKTARVVEEVVIDKVETTHTEQIADTVRSTVVDVEQTGGTDTARTSGTLGIPIKASSTGTVESTDVLKRPAD